MAALTALKTSSTPSREPPQSAELDDAARAILNQLRLVALDCRAAARADLFEACALLSIDRKVARTAHADAFMKCLPQAIGKKPKMLRPGVAEVSFDEAWVVRLITCALSGDHDSFAFLLRSRVPPWARRNIAFLVASLAENFEAA
ncbi:MAG: hypothetical protein AAGJ74_09590 [Pseudomonadota bacterium]